jgi:integrase
MATIRKRRLPSGVTSWQVDYRDQAGARRHKQFPTRRQADAWLVQARAQVAAGTHVPDSSSATVGEACDLWIAAGELDALEESTLEQRRVHIRLHIKPAIGAIKLSRLTTPRVEQFRDDLVRKNSRANARAILTSLKGALKEARRRGLMGVNPAEDTSVKMSVRDQEDVVIPTRDHIRTIIEKVSPRWRALVLTALFTGLRCSELRGLFWKHVDLRGGVVKVRQRADFRNKIGPPKTKAGRRSVPLAPMVLNALKEWKLAGSGRAKPKTAEAAAEAPRLDLVFPSRRGAIVSNSSIHKECWRPLQLANGMADPESVSESNPTGVPLYTFHALRHAAASLFIEQGWTPKRVQTVMGHSSIQVTYDTYGHLWPSEDDDQKAVAEIEARVMTKK